MYNKRAGSRGSVHVHWIYINDMQDGVFCMVLCCSGAECSRWSNRMECSRMVGQQNRSVQPFDELEPK